MTNRTEPLICKHLVMGSTSTGGTETIIEYIIDEVVVYIEDIDEVVVYVEGY